MRAGPRSLRAGRFTLALGGAELSHHGGGADMSFRFFDALPPMVIMRGGPRGLRAGVAAAPAGWTLACRPPKTPAKNVPGTTDYARPGKSVVL